MVNNKLKLFMNENFLLIFVYAFLAFLGYSNRQNIYYVFGLLVVLKIFINNLNKLENYFSKKENFKIILFSLSEVVVLILLEPFTQWISSYFLAQNVEIYFSSIFLFSIFVYIGEVLFWKKNNLLWINSKNVEKKITNHMLVAFSQLKYGLRLKILFNLSMGRIKPVIGEQEDFYAIKFKIDVQKEQRLIKFLNIFVSMALILVASSCYIFFKIPLLIWCLGISIVFLIYVSMILALRKEKFKKNILVYKYQYKNAIEDTELLGQSK